MNCFPYKETHFFDFIQFPSFLAQLCILVAHPVGTFAPISHSGQAVWGLEARRHKLLRQSASGATP